jgi:hypothetical protein
MVLPQQYKRTSFVIMVFLDSISKKLRMKRILTFEVYQDTFCMVGS